MTIDTLGEYLVDTWSLICSLKINGSSPKETANFFGTKLFHKIGNIKVVFYWSLTFIIKAYIMGLDLDNQLLLHVSRLSSMEIAL